MKHFRELKKCKLFFFLSSLNTHTPSIYLEGHTADREVAAIFKHVEVLGHQGGAMHQAVCCLRVVASLRVLPCHVLQPGESQIWRVLIALSNPTQREEPPSHTAQEPH